MSASWPHLGRKEALHPRGPWCTVTQRRPTKLAEFVREKKSTITDNLFSPGRRIAARVFRHSSPSALLNNVSIPLAVIASRCHCLDVIEGLFHLLNSIGVAARGLGHGGSPPILDGTGAINTVEKFIWGGGVWSEKIWICEFSLLMFYTRRWEFLSERSLLI